ncbi:hypothetical protein VIGAN_11109100 [Vigna angularis var. angularis]|uniref:Uncharacterized protein n=1 Tax=Vigna angularis var. angularis TaxID=157739 RepID=A0A0S3T9N0_PHAAN|nr:hypothetical protein VIGAN_11109100 [Vigna angularis var. angularis]
MVKKNIQRAPLLKENIKCFSPKLKSPCFYSSKSKSSCFFRVCISTNENHRFLLFASTFPCTPPSRDTNSIFQIKNANRELLKRKNESFYL